MRPGNLILMVTIFNYCRDPFSIQCIRCSEANDGGFVEGGGDGWRMTRPNAERKLRVGTRSGQKVSPSRSI